MIADRIGPTTQLPERPFTDLRYTRQDLQVMRFMASCAWLALESSAATEQEPPIFLYQPDAERWVHRFVLTQPERLRRSAPLTIVGFFGLRNPGGDVALAQRLDRELLPELSQHEALLAYVSVCLPTGNFANLVLFASPEGKEQWGMSEKHAAAVRLLTPDYYAAVRLYNGELPDGLAACESLRLRLVKYYDYGSRPLWRAVRSLEA